MHHIRHPVKEKSTAGCDWYDLTQSQEESVRMDVQSLVKRERDTQSWISEAPNNSVCGLHFQLSSLLVFREDALLDQLPLCVSMARRDARSEASAGDVVMRVLCGKRDIMM